MEPLAIVDVFDEGADRLARLLEITIVAAVDLLVLECLDEAFRTGIVVRIANRLMLGSMPCASNSSVYSLQAYCTPQSE